MNLYDPADRICYVHLSCPAEPRTTVADTTAVCSLLPSGYANQSPRTRSLVRAPRDGGLPPARSKIA
jgi:hypothetical protein